MYKATIQINQARLLPDKDRQSSQQKKKLYSGIHDDERRTCARSDRGQRRRALPQSRRNRPASTACSRRSLSAAARKRERAKEIFTVQRFAAILLTRAVNEKTVQQGNGPEVAHKWPTSCPPDARRACPPPLWSACPCGPTSAAPSASDTPT